MKDFYRINNTDGSPRWMWPVSSKIPHFLKFYSSNTWKQKAFRVVVQLIFSCRMQRLFFTKSDQLVKDALPNHENWALFFGTPGPNSKRILYFENENKEDVFRKIKQGENSLYKLRKEATVLRQLFEKKDSFSFSMPTLQKEDENQIDVTGLTNQGRSSKWTNKHSRFVKELRVLNAKEQTIGSWSQWNSISKNIARVSRDGSKKIPQVLIDKMVLLKSQMSRSDKFLFQFTHGDFTPWNSFKTSNDKLAVIDWEMASEEGVYGNDFFHFHIQNGILVERKSAKSILDEIIQIGMSQNLFKNEVELLAHFRLYLLQHISSYTALYMEQENWHIQISWQIEAWLELLNEMIVIWNNRKLFIGDLFDFLKDKNYAGLKLKFGRPEELNEYSDLDILLEKSDVKRVVKWIKQKSIVENVNVQSQSFMKAITILFADGSRLHLDLISQLKRKSKVFLDAKEVLSNAQFNTFDVRDCAPLDTSKYIALFYALNGSSIPSRYKKHADVLLPLAADVDEHMYHFYCGESPESPKLIESVNALKVNQGVSGFKNKVVYGIDTLKKFIGGKGMVITFSGVDGAGKSTIIEEIKQEFDKKYRKPVVVLRHRPSLIPILSAMKYGKEGAEKKSVENLPRQGGNTSFLNSLIRFSYYYADYFFGQFYIWVKYVMRGYVVIYDRYYYDMINDGKRSNIKLPKFITKLGFLFLLKPKYNFFLYANAETILERKQELDRKTIHHLTFSYKSLFSSLQKRSFQTKYVSIKNEVIKETKQSIFQTIGQIV